MKKKIHATESVIYPVILAVPERVQAWQGRRQVQALSRMARAAARLSTRRHNSALGRLRKNDEGVPLPSKGWHWSVAHKPAFVAGVAGRGSLGIDIEPLRSRSRKLFSKVADQEEWQLGHDEEWQLFYRFWTAKEAVLKAAGVGLKGLSSCRVVSMDGPDRVTLEYQGKVWLVRQSVRYGHMAAVTANGVRVNWVWPPEAR